MGIKDVTEHYDYNTRQAVFGEPKRIFVRMGDLLEASDVTRDCSMLDVGCGNAALTYHLMQRFPEASFTASDISAEDISAAAQDIPEARFVEASIFDMPEDMTGKFDVVTCAGVLIMFDEQQLALALDNLIRCTRPGGRLFILSTFNEYGVDAMVKWRKIGVEDDWVSDLNVYAFETFDRILEGRCKSHRYHACPLDMVLPRTDDPRRAWTMKTEKDDFQLFNDIKITMDQYVLEIET